MFIDANINFFANNYAINGILYNSIVLFFYHTAIKTNNDLFNLTMRNYH